MTDPRPVPTRAPFDTPALIQRRMTQLYEACGAGGFHFTLPLEGDDAPSDWDEGEIIDVERRAASQLAPSGRTVCEAKSAAFRDPSRGKG